MHRYVVLGINHKFAPLEVRERVAYAERRVPAVLRSLREKRGCDEAVVLSTCNRVEVYAFTPEENARDRILEQFAEDHSMQPDFLARYCYFYRGREAVEHLIRVSGGLDSLVLGETQIVSQVKKAYLLAQSENATGKALNGLFHSVFAAVKRLHTDTGISQGQLSISSVAVRFIRRVFESLSDKTALLIGAGEVGELTLTYLKEEGVGRVIVVSRTMDRAREVARRFQGDAVPFELLEDYLPVADVVISQTSAEGNILGREAFRKAQKKRGYRSLFALDLAVPRDIAQEAGDLDGVFLYNVDDLEQVVAEHALSRSSELQRCRDIVREETDAWLKGFQALSAGPMIRSLRERAEAFREAEVQRLLERLPGLDETARAEIQALAYRLTNKLLHAPVTAIKREAAANGDPERLRLIARALDLEDAVPEAPAEPKVRPDSPAEASP